MPISFPEVFDVLKLRPAATEKAMAFLRIFFFLQWIVHLSCICKGSRGKVIVREGSFTELELSFRNFEFCKELPLLHHLFVLDPKLI